MNIATKSRNRNFNFMIIGQIISIVGSGLLRFALSLYVLDTTGRADIYATLYAISSIPLLLSPLGGAIADRYNRRNLMVIIDLTNTVITALLFIFLISEKSSILLIGIIMTLLSAVSSAETPTSSACIPLLVEESKIESANGIVSAVGALGGVAAPVLGGVLYGILGINNIVVISGLAFLFAAIMEIFIKIPFTKRPHKGNMLSTIFTDIKIGFKYVWESPLIRKSVVVAALLNLVLTPLIIVGIPIILRTIMESSDRMYGVGMGLINAASILGALSVGIFAKKMNMKELYKWILLIALLLLPMALSLTPLLLSLGYFSSFILFFLFSVPLTMMITIISVFVISKVQKSTPNENLGKVMAIITSISQCVAPIGMMVYGGLFEILNNKPYIIILFTCIAVALLSLLTKRLFKNRAEGI